MTKSVSSSDTIVSVLRSDDKADEVSSSVLVDSDADSSSVITGSDNEVSFFGLPQFLCHISIFELKKREGYFLSKKTLF